MSKTGNNDNKHKKTHLETWYHDEENGSHIWENHPYKIKVTPNPLNSFELDIEIRHKEEECRVAKERVDISSVQVVRDVNIESTDDLRRFVQRVLPNILDGYNLKLPSD